MVEKERWVIQDWTGQMFRWSPPGNVPIFDSFEEAWDYIYEHDPAPAEDHPDYENWYDDYYVVEYHG